MIDLPISLYIQYKNLSSLLSQAESQKDLIASVIKKIEGQSKIILEYAENSAVNEKKVDYKLWEAKCIICHTVSDNNDALILSSIKKLVKNTTENSTVYFDTIDLPGRISSWKVDIAEFKPIVVHSGTEVKINFNSMNGIFIQSTGKSLKNAAQGDVIHVQVSDWFSKKNTPHSTEIIEAKVVAPNEVEYVGKQ